MSHIKSHADLEKELQEAQKLVTVGGIYSHYKKPENLYTVTALAIQEATEKICVVYQPEYGKKLLFIRDLDNWLDKPIVNGREVKRFTLVKYS